MLQQSTWQGSVTGGYNNVLRRGGNGEPVMEGAAPAVLAPGLLEQLPATDGHVGGGDSEVQLEGAGGPGGIHTGEPGSGAA